MSQTAEPITYPQRLCGEVRVIGKHYYECVALPHDTERRKDQHYFMKDPYIVVEPTGAFHAG